MILGPFFLLEYKVIFRFQQRYLATIFSYHFLRKRNCFRLKKYCTLSLVTSSHIQCRSVFLFALPKRRKTTLELIPHTDVFLLRTLLNTSLEDTRHRITTTRKHPKHWAASFLSLIPDPITTFHPEY